eukprot:191736_1
MHPPSKKIQSLSESSASNDDYLQNLLTKIRRKFKFLDNLDDSEWTIQIGDDIVEKDNANKLQKILKRTPPIPVIQIVKTVCFTVHAHTNKQISANRYVITIHFGDEPFDYPLTSKGAVF